MKLLSIRTHLFLLVLAMAIPLAGALGYGIYADMQNSIARTKTSLRALANSMVANTGKTVHAARAMVGGMARRPQVRLLDPQYCARLLEDVQASEAGYLHIEYAGLDGRIACAAPTAAPALAHSLPAPAGQPAMGKFGDRWVVTFSAPILDQQGSPVGTLRLLLDLNELDPGLPAELLPAGSRYGFFQEDGIMVWRNLDPEHVIGSRPDADAARRIVQVRDGDFESLAVDGVTRYFSVVPMPQTHWTVFVGLPASNVYDAAKQRAIHIAFIAMAGIVLLLMIATFIARRIARPIAELERCARVVHNGDFSVRANVDGPGEVAAVAEELNAMIEAHQASNVQLRIAAATFESHQGIVVTDASQVILRVNQTFSALSGYSADEAIGRRINILNSDRHDASFYDAMWRTLAATGTWEGEIWNRLKSGEVRPHWLTISAVDDHQVVTNYVAIYTDISERKEMEDQVRHLAFYDALTNLPNRRLLNDRLGQALAGSRRNSEFGALLFIDLDNFKPLNDQHGHGAGDLLLMEVAGRLKKCVREVDTVARFGGDEFVVMLSELNADRDATAAQAGVVAEKIRQALAQPYQLSVGHHGTFGVEHHCTASIGIAVFGHGECSQDDVLKWADAAMYAAKASGRNAIHFYP